MDTMAGGQTDDSDLSKIPNGGSRGAIASSEEDSDDLEGPHVATVHSRPKDPRSRAKYNIISRLFFFWMDPLFWTGWRRDLTESDLYVHPRETDSEKLLNRFNRYWAQELERKKHGRSARLWWVILKSIWRRLTLEGVILFLEVALQVGQSKVLGFLAEYFSLEDPTQAETREAYLLATAIVLMAFVVVVLHAHGFLIGQKIGMMVRVITTGAIYQKVLTLSQVTVGKVSVGHVVNLASNDVHRFDLAFLFIHFLWIAPIHLVVFTYLVYLEVQWSAFLATGFIILQVPLQIILARFFTHFRFKAAKITDRRVKIMNEMITGIRLIKMYAWEYAFKRIVTKLRRSESYVVLQGGLIRASLVAYRHCSIPLMMLLIFVHFTATGGMLTLRRVFTTLSLVNFLRRTTFTFFIRSQFTLSEAWVAYVRIKRFLELDELSQGVEEHDYLRSCAENSKSSSAGSTQPPDVGKESTKTDSTATMSSNTDPAATCKDISTPPGDALHVRVSGLSASWSYEREKMVLENITFEVDQGSPLLAVVGPVGAGKSTLLQCLLGELKPMEGCVDVQGRLSYASQDPWVFSGTLRENILFGLPYRKTWYNTVIEACTLDKDIVSLIHGDLTLVGERGVTLSGGQKARVSLARAVYHDADVYLLDDPLSAVDTAVARHLFERVIRGLLWDKLVVLVTHQLQFARQADKILAIKDGKMEAYGSHEDLVARGVDPTILVGVKKKKRDEFTYEEDGDEENGNGAEQKEEVPVTSPSKTDYLGDDLQFPNDPELDTASIYSAPSMLSLHSAIEGGSSKHEAEKDKTPANAPPAEEKAHGSITMATYYRYFHAGGSYLFLLLVFVVFIMGEASVVMSDWWLSDWAGCPTLAGSSTFNVSNETLQSSSTSNETLRGTCELSRDQRVGVYAGIISATLIINFSRTILFYFLCVNASRVLHNRMFGAVLRAPVLFFDTNPIGRVLNRFSKDVGFLDDLLPIQFVEYLLLLLRFFAILCIASASNPLILIPAVLVMAIFLVLRWFYLKTSRDIKRLEAISRSPLYSHISTTLQGLPTIRTFRKQSTAIDVLHRHQNKHSQGWYLYLVSTRWFGMRIDIVSALFLAAVAFISIPLSTSLNAGLVGLALTYTVSLAGMFQFCVRLSAEVENIMISAERIMDYGRLEPEAPLETLPPQEKPPPEWPEKGEVVFDDVTFRYSEELPLVLKSLCFSVKSGEKIGIVGRTGAGKSSLLAVLFRMAEPFGVVNIDGVNTKEIGLHDLRKGMSIIPQDPVLFSGTMRYNLDPFDEYTDAELWDSLEQVQLKPAIEALEGQLECEVTEGGSNFSVGQRQLVCLARALLRKNKILVLDEATANVDMKTDRIIQQAIRDMFSECSVLTIAHRLNTVMDSDRILVLNKGQVREFDSPYVLLQDPQSQLKRMVDQTGPSASRKLHQMAQEAHLLRKEHTNGSFTEKQGDTSGDSPSVPLIIFSFKETAV